MKIMLYIYGFSLTIPFAKIAYIFHKKINLQNCFPSLFFHFPSPSFQSDDAGVAPGLTLYEPSRSHLRELLVVVHCGEIIRQLKTIFTENVKNEKEKGIQKSQTTSHIPKTVVNKIVDPIIKFLNNYIYKYIDIVNVCSSVKFPIIMYSNKSLGQKLSTQMQRYCGEE